MAFRISGDRTIIFDGATGTVLQSRGLKAGELPELLNVTAPAEIEEIHREYFAAGADVVLTNTFGANKWKAESYGYSMKEVVSAAVANAKRAAAGFGGKYVALDIGPCGRVLKPTGDLPFEEAVADVAETVRAAEGTGADLIVLETFTDLYELKAAVIAAKENSDLPIAATMSFEENGRTFFGTTVESMVMTLEGLGVTALGVNCSLGPAQIGPIVKRLLAASSIPVIVKPNAGLPTALDGAASYDVTPEEFARRVRGFAEDGASIVGGCCGTTPEYIRLVKEMTSDVRRKEIKNVRRAGICSPQRTVFFGEETKVIGERLNPTGKKSLQAALRSGDMNFVMREAIREQEQGADVLDVNMGLPDIDEPAMLERAVTEIQSVTDLPLQLDSSDASALERAARVYNGKPLINSVSGKAESLAAVLPIAKKYGAAVLGLTLDDSGIPTTAEQRVEIAGRIIAAAEKAGIPRVDILIDCLVMTVSAQQDQAAETLRALRMVKEKFGVKTVLGVSNVSFGLPARPLINRTMLAMALEAGLDAPIMNPGDAGMAETVAAFRVLSGQDRDSMQFIKNYAGCTAQQAQPRKPETAEQTEADGLREAIIKGLKKEAASGADILLKTKAPMAIIEETIVPALNEVGCRYENGLAFLPQLIRSAEAAKSSFTRLRAAMTGNSSGNGERRTVVLATVRGDIHDIGKNIVRVIMENYNFRVIDLGRDVPQEKIAAAAKESGAEIVGLSALMTTTVENMRKTIEFLRRECPDVRIIVGGAVLTQQLAEKIGSDYYARDAMDGVRIAEKI